MSIVAAIQMCSTLDVDANLASAHDYIGMAVAKGAQLVVLPENFAIMGSTLEEKLAPKEAFGHGPIQTFLANTAKENGVWIVGGTIPIISENTDKVYAASLVFDAQGRCVARYNKMHLFDVTLSEHEEYKESEAINPGNEIVLIDTPVGKLGLTVCYDIRFPELFRCLFNKGAEIVAVPAAFTQTTGIAHWEILLRSRAIENFCYMIGACQGGTHETGRKTYGNSMIIAPWGNIIAQKVGTEPGVITAPIDLNQVAKARKSIPIKEHQRIFQAADFCDKEKH